MLIVTPSNPSEIRHVTSNESLSPNPSNCVVLRGVVLWFFPADHRGRFNTTVLHLCAYESKVRDYACADFVSSSPNQIN